MSRTDSASRVVKASPERVYAALVDPDALTAWLPPDGMTGRFDRFDARPGGSYRLILTYADAASAPGKATAESDVVEARFLEPVPGVRVAQAVDFVSEDTAFAGTMRMTWELRAVEGGTCVEITADDVPVGISAEDHAAGLNSSLSHLAAYLDGVPGETARVIYRTATSLDGFIADDANSLGWLFAVEHDDDGPAQHEQFLESIGVLVAGSTTYEWVLAEASLLEQPEKWQGFYGDRPTFVFSTRELPRPSGADVRFVTGSVTDALPVIRSAAGSGDIWVVGGGDLAGQFADVGALDQIEVSIAPVTLAAGAPLLPRRIDSTRLRLVSVVPQTQFIVATYTLAHPPA